MKITGYFQNKFRALMLIYTIITLCRINIKQADIKKINFYPVRNNKGQ